MGAELLLLFLRFGLILLLYLFLLGVAVAIWRDLGRRTRQEEGQAGLAKLWVLEPGETDLRPGEVIAVGPVSTIGRAYTNQVYLNDSHVSAEHALLTYRHRRWWLEDLDSTNGTFINHQQVRGSTVVNYGDIIDIGRVRLRLERP